MKVEIAKRKAYTKLKLRESEDRVKRGQCALTPHQILVGLIVIKSCIRSRRWRQQSQNP